MDPVSMAGKILGNLLAQGIHDLKTQEEEAKKSIVESLTEIQDPNVATDYWTQRAKLLTDEDT